MKQLRKYISVIVAVAMAAVLSSCTDWLQEPSPGTTSLDDFYTSADAAVQNVNAAYVPLAWEYNSTYFSEWFIGDIVSDDALKGGQYVQSDMADAYDMENWKTIPTNTLLLEYYRAKFQGVQRCNLVLHYVPDMDDAYFEESEEGLKSRILGEAYFLRAMYYFQLIRVFGGVPLVTDIMTSDTEWAQPRASVSDIYTQIIADLTEANNRLWVKSDSRYADTDLGRATKGAAQAMLLKVYLYQQDYASARAWGDSIIASGEYSLCANYADNFTLEGENGEESVFEVQYVEEGTSDYGEGYGFTRGTFTTILTRSRSQTKFGSNAGWGFNKPTQNLYDEYETDDPRRDITILTMTESEMSNPSEETYLGSAYCSRKYALYSDDNSSCYTLAHASRGPLNYKVIRYADVLLMYAEACEQAGSGAQMSAEDALEMVRSRARNNATDPSTALPTYPNYTISINGSTISPSLQQAIRHERRVELAMEGHRWFDICRWKGFDGTGVKAHMDAYKATETTEAQAEMAEFVEGKHELFPIPADEISLNPMEQNPGY